MSMQEVFTTVAIHLLRQGKQSIRTERSREEGRCAYRSAHGGLKCAIGKLITDEHYTQDLEGLSVSSGNVLTALYESGVPYMPECFLYRLQEIHDCYEPVRWEALLRGFAMFWYLEFPDTAALLSQCQLPQAATKPTAEATATVTETEGALHE